MVLFRLQSGLSVSNYQTVVHWLWNNWARSSERCCIRFVSLVWCYVCVEESKRTAVLSWWISTKPVTICSSTFSVSQKGAEEKEWSTHPFTSLSPMVISLLALFSLIPASLRKPDDDDEGKVICNWNSTCVQCKETRGWTCWEITFINARLNQILIKPEERRRLIEGIVRRHRNFLFVWRTDSWHLCEKVTNVPNDTHVDTAGDLFL